MLLEGPQYVSRAPCACAMLEQGFQARVRHNGAAPSAVKLPAWPPFEQQWHRTGPGNAPWNVYLEQLLVAGARAPLCEKKRLDVQGAL